MINSNKPHSSYKDATGTMDFGLTNDYMFHAVFQKNKTALIGLIGSVIHMRPEEIKSVIITNPIKIGEQMDEKSFVLDIEVLLNNDRVLNLEMQMENQHNWQDRSLSYLCRSFDQLYQGEQYVDAKPVTHIGFLNFSPFPETPEFYASYRLLNIKNHTTYSDKLTLSVIDLKHIELATEEDKAYKIDYWARLFTATTWEELKMIADKDIYLEAATQSMYELSSDELVQRQCRARRDYYKQINSHNKTIREFEEAQQKLQETQTELQETQTELQEAQTELQEAQTEIERLQKYIENLEKQQN